MATDNKVLWAQRGSDRPRRRHEMTCQARIDDASLRFLSRPGTFSYGRFDNGARALVETMHVDPGDRILDLGCGCGTNGIVAALRSGPTGHVTLIDSNLRSVAMAKHNADQLKVPSYDAISSHTLVEPAPRSFDIVLANPPYYGQMSITATFIAAGRRCLKPGGRFYLVTKQVEQTMPLMEQAFGEDIEANERRGYVVFRGSTPRLGKGAARS